MSKNVLVLDCTFWPRVCLGNEDNLPPPIFRAMGHEAPRRVRGYTSPAANGRGRHILRMHSACGKLTPQVDPIHRGGCRLRSRTMPALHVPLLRPRHASSATAASTPMDAGSIWGPSLGPFGANGRPPHNRRRRKTDDDHERPKTSDGRQRPTGDRSVSAGAKLKTADSTTRAEGMAESRASKSELVSVDAPVDPPPSQFPAPVLDRTHREANDPWGPKTQRRRVALYKLHRRSSESVPGGALPYRRSLLARSLTRIASPCTTRRGEADL